MLGGIDLGLSLALISALASALAWHRSLTRNQYNREREYSYLIKAIEQQNIYSKELTNDHRAILKELDTTNDRLSRLEILLIKESKHHV
jgi:hypothetical protein